MKYISMLPDICITIYTSHIKPSSDVGHNNSDGNIENYFNEHLAKWCCGMLRSVSSLVLVIFSSDCCNDMTTGGVDIYCLG